MLGGTGSPGGDELLTVTVVRDEHGYGMKVSGDNPVYVQSVKEHGAAWRAGLRAGDRILRVDGVPVHHHTHQQVVHMIRANATAVLTVHQNTSRHKTPITAPVPVNSEKQRQLEVSKVHTVRLMLEQEQKYIRDLRNELSKVPDVRKQAQLESSEQRCSILQHEIDTIMAGQPAESLVAPHTPRLTRTKTSLDKSNAGSPPPNATSFLSGLPRSLSNLTGQSLRNLRTRQTNKQENQPPLVRQNSDESNNKRRHVHNNTVPMVPTTCLDNVTPPPLPPRSIERPKRHPLSPNMSPGPMNPLAKPKPSSSPIHKQYYKTREKVSPMHQSMPSYESQKMRMSSHSLDGELDGPQPNSIALQMSYPLVNVPPPPVQTDNRGGVPVLHVRSQSSPEHLDHGVARGPVAAGTAGGAGAAGAEPWERGTPPPGTPPPPYARNTQPCIDPQRAIISMEEDDSPASETSNPGLFSNLRTVLDSKARTAVLLNWLLGERRCACATLLLLITDGYRAAQGVSTLTLRRWAADVQHALPGGATDNSNTHTHTAPLDPAAAADVQHALLADFDKEEILRNVFRKARQKAKEEMAQQLNEFQVKRQVGLGGLYGPDDKQIERCVGDKAQEQVIVERLLVQCVSGVASAAAGGRGAGRAGAGCGARDARAALLAALQAAALCLQCRPAAVTAAAGGARAGFLQRDKQYKQRVKQLAKLQPQPLIIRGHHLQLQALTSEAHCHHCEHVIWGLAPQAYVCTDCKLRVHRACAKAVEEACCIDGDHHNNRISRLIDLIHPAPHPAGQDSNDKKSRKTSSTSNFLNMERNTRKMEDEQPWDQTLTPQSAQGEAKREGSSEEPTAPEAEVETNDAAGKEQPSKDTNWRTAASSGRGVNRAESCRERDAPRRGKHRNASDPNRLTAHNNHDLEGGAPTAPSGSSSSSSLSSRSNESTSVPPDQQASQSDWSEEEEPLAAVWADSLPPQLLDSLLLSARLRKRQEVIHELIVSEGSHVRWLKVLSVDFLRPLERQPALLPADELRALFPNLPGVRERHVKLYADLRALRNDTTSPIVGIRPVADAMLNTLGDSGYAGCLSRFCRGQRMALETLRERRRKSKELHQLLAAREQLPRCGRLQLRDLLACVWQRLTKYQLLLEGVLKTVCESDADSDDDVARLKRAHDTAKDVLQSVDTAIRTAENEHRLRAIQNKLEVRAGGGGEWDELRRLDLAARGLRMEGELALRHDGNKRVNVLALMLTDVLVLLQREGDKFVLRPIPAPSQQAPLSPLVRWDKVLFRPNAAARNTFFLMNINGVQMHELSTNTAAEYATWVKNIQECPLAKLAEQKPAPTPAHQHSASRSTDDSGINVSRNPSDASEKSAPEPREPERREPSADRARETEIAPERDAEDDKKDELLEREDKHVARRPTLSRISTHSAPPPRALEPQALVTISPPRANAAQLAERAFTPRGRPMTASRALEPQALVTISPPRANAAQLAERAFTPRGRPMTASRALEPQALVTISPPRANAAQLAERASPRGRPMTASRALEPQALVTISPPRANAAQLAERAFTPRGRPMTASRALEPQALVTISPPRANAAQLAERAFTPREQLRRLDSAIQRALVAKSAVVGELLGVPAGSHAQVADLAVAEALGDCDTSGELRLQRSASTEEPSEVHTLLLAALTQANQLTESLARALTVNEAACVAARARGRCDSCRQPAAALQRSSTLRHQDPDSPSRASPEASPSRLSDSFSVLETISTLEKETSFDMLTELQLEPSAEDALESNLSSASLARSWCRCTAGCSARCLACSRPSRHRGLPPRHAARAARAEGRQRGAEGRRHQIPDGR
ncbi:LOW QUALITY PROTEIN: rho guanine nucleotide exchange factor 2 [Choristoneura fumiferana]|uniref:LOW QUALITY PROTEIN: rho guanine nucleotide exchange factor 2 n=1 Tax=Choristoneura fumiferana TaxID=7141 RepID=UPI003D158E77